MCSTSTRSGDRLAASPPDAQRPPSFVPFFLSLLAIILASEMAVMFVLPHILPPDVPPWFEASADAALLALAVTGPIWWLLCGVLRRLRDELRATTEAARDTREELNLRRSALDQHGIVSETDARGQITYVNDGFCRVSGYCREELLGNDHRMVNSGHHPRDFWGDMFAALAHDGVWRGEVCNRAKDGSLYWVDCTNVAFRDGDGRVKGYASMRINVTERKQLEGRLREQAAELELANQGLAAARREAESACSSKSQFLANMSHEIRTPLTAILGFTDVLLEREAAGDGDESVRREALTTIRNNGRHLLSLINDILDLSKIEAGQLTVESIDLSPLRVIEEVYSILHVSAVPKGIQFKLDRRFPLPASVRGDPTRLRQILINLVGNAIKFTEAGKVVLRCALERAGSAPVIRFDVSDTGIGMTPQQIDRLFEVFSQADASTTRRFGGTGLGLAISRHLARMLGGDILVQSAPGRGSTFTLTLPAGPLEGVTLLTRLPSGRMADAGTSEAASTSPGAQRCLLGKRVLLADDGPDNLRLISYHLRRAGAEVETAENGRIAVEKALLAAAPGSRAFDLILMDMQMPEMDGYQAAQALRQRDYTAPIIALTANAMEGDRQRCLDAGCNDYVAKPIDKVRLLSSCARWCQNATGATT